MYKLCTTIFLSSFFALALAQGPQDAFEKYMELVSKNAYAEAKKLQTEKASAVLVMEEDAKGYSKVLDVLEVEHEAMIRAKYESGFSKAFYLIRKDDKWYMAAPKEIEKTGAYYISCMDNGKEVVLAESETNTEQVFKNEKYSIAYTLADKEEETLRGDPYSYIMMAGKIMTISVGDEAIRGRVKRAELIKRGPTSTLFRFDGVFEGERYDGGKFSVSYQIDK